MSANYEHVERFMRLFDGLTSAYGTGQGRWIKRPPTKMDFLDHLEGRGPGIGIAPLRPDNTVKFAAIDLDEPDFEAARQMQELLPGASFVERTRSGNAHVWVFFDDPCPAWVAMGILREACIGIGKPHVEVFPKNHDFSRVKLGNYINLPYHGGSRPVWDGDPEMHEGTWLTLSEFLAAAEHGRLSGAKWTRTAEMMQLTPPDKRERRSEFGTQPLLHVCAESCIANAQANPVTEGHRQQVYFMLAKCLTNWEGCDRDEALGYLRQVRDDSDAAGVEHVPNRELERILDNAERGQYTSTGCDDPLCIPWTDPSCPIAHPRA